MAAKDAAASSTLRVPPSLESIADEAFHTDQIRASTIISRLPAGFFPTDCLVIDEGTSPILYKTFATLINCVPMFVVTPGSATIKPEKGLLGYIAAPNLKAAIELREKESELLPTKVKTRAKTGKTSGKGDVKFHVIIFIAKEASPVLPIISKIITERLKPGGAAILCSADSRQVVDSFRAMLPSLRITTSTPFMNYLLPSEEIILMTSAQKE